MRRANTTISEIKINGVTRYRVTYPTANGRKREHYVDRKKAEKRLKEIKEEQKRFGLSVTAMTSTTRADAVAAEKILAGTGLTLVEIARAAVEQKRKEQSGIPIADAVEAFMQSRGDRSAEYLATLKSRASYISNFFAGRTTSSITADDCQRMLDGLGGTSSPGTVRHYRTQLSMLFAFCESRGWITGNPAKHTAQVKVTGREAAILTPQEAATLLSVCHRDLLPGIIIATFCGLRQAEIERLDWKAVSLAQGIITIGAGVAKTNSRRVVTIPDNARAWLAPCAQESGNVWPSDPTKARDLWTLSRVNAGYGPFFSDFPPARDAQLDPETEKTRKDLKPWPANALRHSAISYRLAMTPDLAKLAYESGNSPAIIQRHYNGLASPQDANAFFAIMPTVAGNITQFSKAA
ncbi:MAG: site-specific integrase [Phycisphaerae bacterium]|jgi:integrase